MKPKTQNKNIIIIGAGLIGTSIALSLKNTELSIQLLEKDFSHLTAPSQQSSRPISLSYGSVKILTALGIWDQLAKDACPILSVHVSEKGKWGVTHFSAAEQQVPALGYVISFSALQSALYHAIAAQTVITPIQSIQKIFCDDKGACVSVNTITEKIDIQADLCIAADGTHSTCRDLLGISHTEHDSGDVADIYQIILSEHHDHTAYERFTEYGVLAVLPLIEKNQAQLVWTITPRVAKKIMHWDEKNILLFLQDAFENRLSIHAIKKITRFPLKTILAEKQITTAAVLLGNAAHTLYPVAAQGFNLGLHDVAVLADLLIETNHQKKNIGNMAILKNYVQQIQTHQKNIYRLTDQLSTTFELPGIGKLRGLSLLLIDCIPPIKNKLAKRTMGIAEKMPALWRGNCRE